MRKVMLDYDCASLLGGEFAGELSALAEVHIVRWKERITRDTGPMARWYLREMKIPHDDFAVCDKQEYLLANKIHMAIEYQQASALSLSLHIPVCQWRTGWVERAEGGNVRYCTTTGEILAYVREIPTTIRTKREMYRLHQRGHFGNYGINFDSVDEAERHDGLVAIRAITKGGGRFDPNIAPADIRAVSEAWQREGYTEAQMQYCAMMPEHRIVLQAYVWRTERYLEMDYNTVPGVNMCFAMRHPQHAHGLKAQSLLRTHLSPSDYDDLQELLEIYPDDIIELSAYGCDVGSVPRRNTVIWEVRGGTYGY